MIEELFIKTNYVTNNQAPAAFRAPKSLINGNLGDAIYFLLSDEVRKRALNPSEEDIVAEIRNYMRNYEKERKGELTQHRPIVHIRAKDESWEKIGGDGQGEMANLDIAISDYVLSETKGIRGQNVDYSLIHFLLEKVPIIGEDNIRYL